MAPLVSHAGDGNFHIMLVLDPGDAAEMDRARGVVSDMVALAHGMGGTCTGEAQSAVACGKFVTNQAANAGSHSSGAAGPRDALCAVRVSGPAC